MDEHHTIALPRMWESLSAFMKAWIVLTACLAGITVLAPFFAPSPFFGTVFNDAVQLFVCIVAIGLFARNAIMNHGHVRIFWFLMSVAMGVWAFSSSIWFLS